MKKILLLMAIILPFVLTSCGDDKDEPKQNLEQELIGTWVLAYDDLNMYQFMVFNADHTGSGNQVKDGIVIGEFSFTWSLSGDVLTQSRTGGNTFKNKISIKDDILYVMDEDGNPGFEMKRVKAQG
ncbi:MAG: lipocalin family protein [Muribaculaceae bacterium]|nr:lipocalin family protein [Muribaculaceae bacterium]